MYRHATLRRVRTPLTLLVTAVAGTAAIATSVAPASATTGRPASDPKPTVVLVHGAFADSSSW
ncbi:alpha/beta hydrolase, partial [Streptomyces sp. NPDC056626]